jgi:hypothetical protein
MYCIERHISQALGLPLTIRDDDADVCFPDAELHRPQGCLSQASAQGASSYGEQTQAFDPRLQLLSLLAKHAQIKGSIMELRNKRVA